MTSRNSDGIYPTENETALWVALNRAQRSIYQKMDAALKSNGLPPLRWYDVLWAMERAKNEGVRPFELEKGLIFEQSNLSRLLRRMINAGLVEEAKYENDRRGKLLRITSKGCDIRQQMWQIYGPLIQECMASISCQFDPADVAAALRSLIEQENEP